MIEFMAPSGATVTINIADWQDAKRLKKAIWRELASAGIKVDLEIDVSSLIGPLLRVDSSDVVDAALAPCLARCLRNGEKITDATFNDPEARQDYYDIVYRCAEENIRPLAKGLILKLSTAMVAIPNQAESAQK